MTIQTNFFSSDDVTDYWREHMQNVFAQWDGVINDAQIGNNLELVSCDHMSSDYSNHSYMVVNVDNAMLYVLDFDDETGKPAISELTNERVWYFDHIPGDVWDRMMERMAA